MPLSHSKNAMPLSRGPSKKEIDGNTGPQHCPVAHVALRTRQGQMAAYNWSPSYNQDGQNFKIVAIDLHGFVCQLTPQQKKRDSVSDKVRGRLVPQPCEPGLES